MNGERLRRLRKDRLLTQQELSRMTGISQDGISHLETEKRGAQPSTMKKLAEALGVEPQELMKEE